MNFRCSEMDPVQLSLFPGKESQRLGEELHTLDRRNVAAAHDLDGIPRIFRAGTVIPRTEIRRVHLACIRWIPLSQIGCTVLRARINSVETLEQITAQRQISE